MYASCMPGCCTQFYLSELTKRRGPELPGWPSPLLFLLAYNVLRLRLTKGFESGRGPSTAAAPASIPDEAAAGNAATATHQQQLSAAAEAAAARLLLRVVAAIEEGVTFPDTVTAHCHQGTPEASDDKTGAPSSGPQEGLQLSPGDAATRVSATKESKATVVVRQCTIRLAGLRDVGSFLWALSRAEGKHSAPIAAGAQEDVQAAVEAEPFAKDASLPPSASPLMSSHRPRKPLSLQEAARVAAQAIRRQGGFADRLAVYCEAAIRGANDCLLQRAELSAAAPGVPDGRKRQLVSTHVAGGAGQQQKGAGEARSQSALEALKTFCRTASDMPKPAVSLRSSDLPSLSWVSTAGVSLGLLLNFFSSCKPETREHILYVPSIPAYAVAASAPGDPQADVPAANALVAGDPTVVVAALVTDVVRRSAVLRAPLLAEECGLLQLFHLLRPLAAAARAEMEAPGEVESNDSAPLLPGTVSVPLKEPKQYELPGATMRQQKAVRGSSRRGSGFVNLLREAPAFLFASAAGLLRHAQATSNLPADAPRTAAQVQLLLLAASDFAALLHAHCWSVEALQDTGRAPGPPARTQVPAVTGSADFRRVLQDLLSVFSSIVVRHSAQICGSLALLAAAAEVLSRCGRQVPLPSGSRRAMEAFAPAAIAALRQPASYHLSNRRPSQETAIQRHSGGGAEELKRLATALEALKFVELK